MSGYYEECLKVDNLLDDIQKLSESLYEKEQLLALSVQKTIALKDELLRVSRERDNLFRHVKNHANCCAESSNEAFARAVAQGKVG